VKIDQSKFTSCSNSTTVVLHGKRERHACKQALMEKNGIEELF